MDSKEESHSQLAFFGSIYTVVPGNEWAESLVIDGGVITFVGNKAGAEKLIHSGTKIVHLGWNMSYLELITFEARECSFLVSKTLMFIHSWRDYNRVVATF